MAERHGGTAGDVLTRAISRRGVARLIGAAATGTVAGLSAASAAAQGAPLGTPVPAGDGTSTEAVTFALSDGTTTHGQFDHPAGAAPFPAVLLLQGSGPTDRHETLIGADGVARRPFDQIAAALTDRGLAVFRYDKRGVCPPSRVCDPTAYATQSKPVLSEDAALAYARMTANPLIDAKRTAVLGHSEGAWLAPALPARFPSIRALVLIGTGLGPMHVLSFSQVTLPLLGAAPYDANGDGALAASEIPFADPAAMARFQQRIRPQGQLFLLRYDEGLRPVGLNPVLETNGDGTLGLLTEVRPVYEAFLAGIAHPLAVAEQYADPSILPLARQSFAEAEAFDAGIYASYQTEPMDQQLRTLLGVPSRPHLLIVNGEHDDQTPASSATLLVELLIRAGYEPEPTLRIYPGLGHVLGPQADIFAPVSAEMQPGPVADIGDWLAAALAAG